LNVVDDSDSNIVSQLNNIDYEVTVLPEIPDYRFYFAFDFNQKDNPLFNIYLYIWTSILFVTFRHMRVRRERE